MNKIVLIALILGLILSLFSCSKNLKALYGTWNAIALEEFGRDKLGDMTSYYVFDKNGDLTFVIREEQRVQKGTWKIEKGNKIQMTLMPDSILRLPELTLYARYKLTGDTLDIMGVTDGNRPEEIRCVLVKDK